MRENCEMVDLEIPGMPGLCLVVEDLPDVGRRPCLVAQPQGAAVYAAAWRDASGKIHEWFELWVQDVSSWLLEGEDPLMTLTNAQLDAHWARMVEGLETVHPESVMRLGWEERHPEPLWLSADATSRHKPDLAWSLCTDDAFLKAERLAPFSSTLHRYLWSGSGEEVRLVPTTPGAPEGRRTLNAGEVFGDAVPLNPTGGLMMLRRSSAILLDDFSDLLSGIEGAGHPRERLRMPAVGANAMLLNRPGIGKSSSGFFFARNQPVGHLGEILHLKLCTLRGAFEAVKSAVERTGTPFLGVTADAFGVTLTGNEGGLPYLWNHRVDLITPPQSVRTELGDVREPCFLPTRDSGRSIYRGLRSHDEVRGQGRVRVRSVSAPDDDGLVVLEGSLLTDEPLRPGKLDLLGIEWLNQNAGRLKLFARMEGGAADGSGEYRFASLQTRLPKDLAARLQSSDSTLSSDRVAFHLLPRLGPPCDMYSLGVLALRLLVAGPGVPLGEAVDDLMAMAHLFRKRFSHGNWNTGTASLNEFVKTGEGGPWAEKLGPQRLVGGKIEAAEAFREIPAPMWWQVLEFVSKLFPGEALGSFCKGFDDFLPRALHETFTEPLAELDTLLVATRDLMFGNPQINRELLGIIRRAANSR